MISIQKYLRQRLQHGSQSGSGSDFGDAIRLLIEGIQCCAVEGAPEDVAEFQESTEKVLAALDSSAPPEEVLTVAAGAMEAMQLYHRRMVEFLRRPDADLQERVKSLTAAVTAVGGASSDSIDRLQQIKGRILASLNLKEIRDLRQLLSECLDGVMVEAERRRDETDRAAEMLNRTRKRPAGDNSGGEPPREGLTDSLPGRAPAEEAIAQACQDEDPAFVVVIVLNQLGNASRTFGPAFSDLMVQRYTAFVRQRLAPADRLYRWSGAAVVALVRRKKSLEAVRLELAHPLTQRVVTRAPESEVLVPISARWTVLPLMASPKLLFRKLDSFADFQ